MAVGDVKMRKSVELCNFENLASFPLILVLYQNVATNLVNQGKMSINASATNTTVVDPGQWCVRVCVHTLLSLIASSIVHSFAVPNNSNSESPYDAIQGIIKYYVFIGFLSIFCYWVAWASWIVAAERQVRRIR